uniref:ARAD1C35376p n=1 Tax=Blastobotrys adeninivorans TaxID=409370 RepID=A0A060T8B2_BLAAD
MTLAFHSCIAPKSHAIMPLSALPSALPQDLLSCVVKVSQYGGPVLFLYYGSLDRMLDELSASKLPPYVVDADNVKIEFYSSIDSLITRVERGRGKQLVIWGLFKALSKDTTLSTDSVHRLLVLMHVLNPQARYGDDLAALQTEVPLQSILQKWIS